jgi:hypothetical protein
MFAPPLFASVMERGSVSRSNFAADGVAQIPNAFFTLIERLIFRGN